MLGDISLADDVLQSCHENAATLPGDGISRPWRLMSIKFLKWS